VSLTQTALRFPSAGEYTYLGLSHGWGCDDGWFEDGVPGDPHIWSRPLGKPLGPLSRTPNGAVPAPEPHGKHGTGGWVYTRSFGNGTHVSTQSRCVAPDNPHGTTGNILRTGVVEPYGRLALEARTRLHALQRTVAGKANVPSGLHMVGRWRGLGLAAGLHLPPGAAARPLATG